MLLIRDLLILQLERLSFTEIARNAHVFYIKTMNCLILVKRLKREISK